MPMWDHVGAHIQGSTGHQLGIKSLKSARFKICSCCEAEDYALLPPAEIASVSSLATSESDLINATTVAATMANVPLPLMDSNALAMDGGANSSGLAKTLVLWYALCKHHVLS